MSSTRRLSILYVGTLPPHQGGSAVSGSLIALGLARRGHRVRAIAPITPPALRAGDGFAQRHPELEVERFEMPYLDVSPDTPPDGEYRELEREGIEQLFGRLLVEERPDVVLVGRECFAWHVVPLVGREKLPSLLRAAGATTIGILNGSYPKQLARGLLERLRAVDRLVAPARHLAASLDGLGVPGVEVVPNAVDVRRFSPRPKSRRLLRSLGLSDDATVVGHVSNLKSLKRPLDVVESAQLALEAEPGLSYLVVGDGPHRSAMEDACVRAGLGDRFRFVDWIDYEEVPAYVNLVDVMVIPSAGEAQARIYLETQASAGTLVASDIPAAKEVVAHGKTGLLFRTGDVHDIAAKTVTAARDAELRRTLGRNARERVQEHALPRVVAAYERQLQEVAAGS